MAEAVAISTALIVLGAVVFAKILTSQFIIRMKRQVSTVDQEKQRILGQLKMIQSQKGITERNKAGLEKKKQVLQRKVNKIKKEMNAMQEDQEHRKKLRDVMRGKLARSPGTGGDEDM
jgi:hypothetical protein